MIKVPEKCLCCGAPYQGGSEIPGKPMKVGLRVFYKCGAIMVYCGKVNLDTNEQLIFRNCCCDECEPGKGGKI